MTEYKVPELIELTLDYALKAGQHDKAYDASFAGKRSPKRKLDRSAHYYAKVWHEDAADNAWRCLSLAA